MAGASIKIGANSSDFQKQMKEVTTQLKLVSSECGVATEKAKLFGSTQEKLTAVQKELTSKMQAQNQMLSLYKERVSVLNADIEKQKSKQGELTLKIDELNKKYKESVEQSGKNSEESKKLKEELVALKDEYSKNERAIESCNKKLVDAKTKMNNTETALLQNKKALEEVNSTIDNSKIDKIASGFENAGEKATAVGKKMSVVSAGIVGVGTASVAAFNAVDDGADNVLKATGAVGEAAKELEDSYKKVSQNIVGDFGDIGSALGEVNTRFGFTGSELETCTEQFLKFSEITGTDATSAVQLVARAMGDAGINSSEYANVLDSLAVAAQASGISIDKLTENITKYGAPMRALGYDTKESIAIFSSWEKAGVNTEIAFSGMKKAISNWSSQGKDSREEFKKTLDEIAKCPDIASATTKSIEIFGAKAGPDLADAIQGGRFEFEEMLNVLSGADGAVEGTFDGLIDGGYEAELTMQNAKLALSEIGGVILETVSPMLNTLTDKIKGLTQWFNGLSDGTKRNIVILGGTIAAIGPVLLILGALFSSISKIVNGIKAVKTAFGAMKIVSAAVKAFALANPVTLIVAGIVALITIIVTLYLKCEWFRNGVNAVFSFIKNIFVDLNGFLTNIFAVDWTQSFGAFGEILNAFSANAKNVIDSVKRIFGGIIDFVAGIFTGDWGRAWEGVKNIFGGIMDGLGAVIKAPLNAVIGLINMAITQLNKISFTAPDWVPFVGGKHFGVNLPKINYLYNGGIVTKPTFINSNTIAGDAFMGRGNQAEAVIPLGEMYRNLRSIVKEEAGGDIILVAEIENIMDGDIISRHTVKRVLRTITKDNKDYKKSKGGNLGYV